MVCIMWEFRLMIYFRGQQFIVYGPNIACKELRFYQGLIQPAASSTGNLAAGGTWQYLGRIRAQNWKFTKRKCIESGLKLQIRTDSAALSLVS